MRPSDRSQQGGPVVDVHLPGPAPTGTERAVATVFVVVAVVGALAAMLDAFDARPSAIGAIGLGAALLSVAVLIALAFRMSRRGGAGPLRSIGRAAWLA